MNIYCTRCSRPVEEDRKIYAIPVCYTCLPAPEPLAVTKLRSKYEVCVIYHVWAESKEEAFNLLEKQQIVFEPAHGIDVASAEAREYNYMDDVHPSHRWMEDHATEISQYTGKRVAIHPFYGVIAWDYQMGDLIAQIQKNPFLNSLYAECLCIAIQI